MSSVKKDMLAEINKEAQKIRERRITAANNKTLEAATFDFFRNIEKIWGINNHPGYDPYLFSKAREALQQRLRGVDSGGKISIEFNVSDDVKDWSSQQVRAITIWWSKAYLLKNKVDPSYCIDISQMLFL